MAIAEPALMEIRHLLQDRKIRLFGFFNDVQTHGRSIVSDAEGVSRPFRRFRDSLQALRVRVNQFSDLNDNQGDIVAAVAEVKQCMSSLMALDDNLSWTGNNVLQACDRFTRVLTDPVPVQVTKPEESHDPNPKRLNLLNEVDELNARLMCLGDYQNGGLEERKTAITRNFALRQAIANDIRSEIVAAPLLEKLRLVQQAVQDLAPLQSRLTHEAGFMQRSMHAINAQIDKISGMLSVGVVQRPRGSLSIKP